MMLKDEYVLIKTGSDEILTVHIYTIMRTYMRNLVKIGLLDFAVARAYGHTCIRTDEILRPSYKNISL